MLFRSHNGTYLLMNSMFSVCRIIPVRIMILWKQGRSMAHNLQFTNAESAMKCSDVTKCRYLTRRTCAFVLDSLYFKFTLLKKKQQQRGVGVALVCSCYVLFSYL